MTTVKRSLPARWLLLAVVSLALVLMHHVPADHGGAAHGPGHAVVAMAAASGPAVQPVSDGHPMADMLHQCLAVVGQFAAWILVLLLGAALAHLLVSRRTGARASSTSGPDPPVRGGGRVILTSVCVLRL
ncbi:hypothetical protein GCM10017786_48290 [Amycolatopsis deserti]|uniref:Uncharacterized protein n=1 Tax=Amycolatopsis deserti TaxID=185696 RepID=A0ABQ3JDT6_9PSEU|nr:hypothetical protein [Amycolatopsis deserti]GHF08810.1 hypothetical protein GCM10017786_48290 [Amycolatopsis deserti]